MIAQMMKRPLKMLLGDTPAVPPNRMIDDGCSTNMAQRLARFSAIPGMLPRERGLVLYSLAYGCSIPGDVVEIGSWQGRSTCYLAQACRDSDNGIVRAIDHFKGNVGVEQQYVVGQSDLSDLESKFRRHVAGAGLKDYVRLYNMTSRDAAAAYRTDFARVRMLFIDGDHSYEGVRNDIELFAPLLQPGGIIVFDDYHSDGPGVVQAVRDVIFSNPAYGQFTQFQGVLIARKTPQTQ